MKKSLRPKSDGGIIFIGSADFADYDSVDSAGSGCYGSGCSDCSDSADYDSDCS